MSFGRPGNSSITFASAPPDRGSFPLDHEGECKDAMVAYLKCMKSAKNKSTDCRHLSKLYLGCRMDKGLMERVSWEDLGFQDGVDATASSKHAQPTPTTATTESSDIPPVSATPARSQEQARI